MNNKIIVDASKLFEGGMTPKHVVIKKRVPTEKESKEAFEKVPCANCRNPIRKSPYIKYCYLCSLDLYDKCKKCNSRRKQKQYPMCFKCANEDYDKCDCGKKKKKDFPNCYECRMNSMNREPECCYCNDTGDMYYGDDVYGPCLHCHLGDSTK